MHAHTTLTLSLSATLAYALPASNCTSTVGTTTTVSAYVLPQETKVVHTPKEKHIVDLKSQIESLKSQLSSQLEASSTLCHGPAETTATLGGYKGNPSATHAAINWSYIKEAHKSRLPATSAVVYPSETCTSSLDMATDAPFPSYTSYANGTATHSVTASSQISNTLSTGVATSTSQSSSTTSLSPTYIPKLNDYTVAEIESGAALEAANKVAIQRLQERNLTGDCTFETARVRTEFRKMSNEDRKSFTDAITCLKQTPASAEGRATGPGILSRYDEYVATHINMTMNIHVTADFLAWHRNYIWEWENDLINTCGYTGNLPYWDWARDAYAPHESEVFNGDEFSMGSDGVFVDGRSDTYLGLMDVTFPPGTGGGCVHSGPFSGVDFSNLGPLDSPYNDNVENDYDLNPRCLVRDLNVYFSSRYLTYSNVTQLLLGQTDIQYFQAEMQGFVGDNKLGVHGAGHWVGGGPSQMQDFHSSPNDPIFFLHHAMVDRTWAIWQALDSESRQDAIYGTETLNNSPASREMELTDSLAFGFAGKNEIFGDLMDTMGGKFCYRYE